MPIKQLVISPREAINLPFCDHSFLPLKKPIIKGIPQMSILIGINLDIGLIADLYSDSERCLQGFEEFDIACRI
jgi:hypothetical protein